MKRVQFFRLFPGLILALIIALAGGVLNAQFLLDEEQDLKKDERDLGSIIPGHIPLNISAVQLKDVQSAIRVSFDVNPKHLGEYVLVRSSEMITTKELALAARIVKIIKAEPNNVVVESDCQAGSHFYAVIPRNRFNKKDIELFRDVNYTSLPVVIGSTDISYAVTGIRAIEAPPARIKVSWQKVAKSGMTYTVYRSAAMIDSSTRLKAADKLAAVIDRDEYLDEGASQPGGYYYAVTVRESSGRENILLIADQTYTTKAVTVVLQNKLSVASIRAQAGPSGVIIQWTVTGQDGERNIQVVRSARALVSITDVSTDQIIGETSIDKKTFRDSRAPVGEYYYALMPYSSNENRGYRFTAGVNITSGTVRVLEKKKDVTPQPEESGTVDEILRKYYYPGKYHLTIKYLTQALAGDEGEFAKAKARLYIGRSYIDIRKYRKALEFVLLPEVKKHFPREAAFWRDYALGRLK